MDRVLILNGPPRSGKDTLSKLLRQGGIFETQINGSFKRPLQEVTAAILGMSFQEFLERYEEIKDRPCPNGLPLTVRKLMIKISEEWVKPLGGKRYFGDMAYRRALIDSYNAKVFPQTLYPSVIEGTTVIYTDGGFGEEVLMFVEKIGAENVHIVRIHRPGVDFSEDSRRYLTADIEGLEKCNFFDIRNDRTERDLLNGFRDVVLDQMRKGG